jgi:hypothetical protein
MRLTLEKPEVSLSLLRKSYCLQETGSQRRRISFLVTLVLGVDNTIM